MIQVTRQGLAFDGTDADVELLRRSFDRHHHLVLSNFLNHEVSSLILPFVEGARYGRAEYEHIGSEFLMERNLAVDALSFLTNDVKLFGLVQAIIGCGSIACFKGRIYKLIPDPHHAFDWHDDLRDHRLIAMSINLSAGTYRGGVLQIRELRSGKIVGEVANTGFGSAVLFRISQDLQHRVTGLEGEADRTSFAGWFTSEPGIYSVLGRSRADSAA